MPKSCHFYAAATVFMWATSYILTKLVIGAFSPGALGFLRCLVASLALLAVVVGKKIRPPAARDIPRFFLAGFCGLALYLFLFNKGTTTIGPTTSCIVIATSPIASAALASLFLKEKLVPLRWLALAAAFCGILTMTLWDGTLELNGGVLWTLAAAFSFAIYNLMQRRLSVVYSSTAITSYSFMAAAILLLPFLPDAAEALSRASARLVLYVVFLGVFPSALGYLSWVKALSIAPKTSLVTNYMFLTPFLSLVMEFIILSQLPDAGTLIGGAVILVSLALFTRAGRKDD